MNRPFWAGKRVLITGHTGFMGGWLALLMQELGAEVAGLALAPPSDPNLFTVAKVGAGMHSIEADIRDAELVSRTVAEFAPKILFHLAAQPIVRASYDDPVGTYATNVLGTVHVLEAARAAQTPIVINVTSDKCYENRERDRGYHEDDAMGGWDPYSSSKGAAELVTSAYRRSFFQESGLALASVRAGNVVGGGDWGADRIVPDFVRALTGGRPLLVRNPNATRPWQHVLEPVFAYALLAEHLATSPEQYAGGWNIGPAEEDTLPVGELVKRLVGLWGEGSAWETDRRNHPHEARFLKLDCAKARRELGWTPRWSLDESLQALVEWYKAWARGEDMHQVTVTQIQQFDSAALGAAAGG